MKAKSARRPLSHHFTKVTPLSKAIAFILFIGLPLIAFFLGVQYGEVRGQLDDIQTQTNTYLKQAPAANAPHQMMYIKGVTPTQYQMGY